LWMVIPSTGRTLRRHDVRSPIRLTRREAAVKVRHEAVDPVQEDPASKEADNGRQPRIGAHGLFRHVKTGSGQRAVAGRDHDARGEVARGEAQHRVHGDRLGSRATKTSANATGAINHARPVASSACNIGSTRRRELSMFVSPEPPHINSLSCPCLRAQALIGSQGRMQAGSDACLPKGPTGQPRSEADVRGAEAPRTSPGTEDGKGR
jgi:hypothetical protein